VNDYEQLRDAFRWEDARSALDGLPAGRGLNIAHEAIDRHLVDGRADDTAIRWLAKGGGHRDLTYAELARDTNRFANALAALGCSGGHGVATLLGRVPELYLTALGTLKGGGVYTPLFSAFGPDPIAMRMNLGRIDVLVTTAPLYRRKVRPIVDQLPHLRHVIIVGDAPPGDGSGSTTSGAADAAGGNGQTSIHGWAELMGPAPADFEIPATDPQSRALLHFTSGTTGRPKGAIHVHEAVVAHAATGRLVLDLHPGDVYWCTADPGWVTGTSYGIISPLVNGAISIVDEAEFDGERWYRTIQDQKVQVFYTAPTALRMLQRLGKEVAAEYDLGSLRLVASVGEPLDPESVVWAQEVFGVPVLDNWWQTETGGIMIANLRTEPVKPGSMGRPLPGITAGLLRTDDEGELVLGPDGDPVEIDEDDEVGELALEAGWPSMFRGYLDEEERYRRCFAGRWYHSGDLARRDADGYYWFVGRNNDVIKSAGHLIGPFEVESALTAHPAVVEAGVIGKPEPTIGAIVKAFVVLTGANEPSDELRRELMGHARKHLGPAVAPREIDFVDHLPHTRSGKIMRRLLLARELGLDEGDTSTLEQPS
jgi:acetyl-CoA synthetase